MKQFYDVPVKSRWKVLCTLMWVNKQYKAAFTTSRTDNQSRHELFWYTLDKFTNVKQEHIYWMTAEGMIIEFKGKQYRILELSDNRTNVITLMLLNMVNIANNADTINFFGVDKPMKK